MRIRMKCPKCGSEQIIGGKLVGDRGLQAVFEPTEAKGFLRSSRSIAVGPTANGCLDCGLVWSYMDARAAREKAGR
jgi:uncharacterized Zn finger protein